jgi:TnpA family transposase
MVKYATAVRLGTAETKPIPTRFTRNKVQNPTYKAFAERGKAVKTLFLARYLHRASCVVTFKRDSMSWGSGTGPTISCSSPAAAK